MENNINDLISNTLPMISKFENYARQRSSKGKISDMMNYVKVTYLRRVTDFPTNKEFGVENWVDLRTNLYADDELYIGQLNALESKNPDGTMVPTYNSSEIFVKILGRCIVDWSFTDMETGSKYAVNEINIRGMLRQDFDYLTEQFNEILTGSVKTVADTEPRTDITDDEKKVSENSLTGVSVG